MADRAGPVADEIAKYLGSDLLFYRADEPRRLVERQVAALGPGAGLGARRARARASCWRKAWSMSRSPKRRWPPLARRSPPIRGGSARCRDHHADRLGADRRSRCCAAPLSVDEAWAAAHVDEDWNMELWGRDEIALERRAFRFAEMQAAAAVLAAPA